MLNNENADKSLNFSKMLLSDVENVLPLAKALIKQYCINTGKRYNKLKDLAYLMARILVQSMVVLKKSEAIKSVKNKDKYTQYLINGQLVVYLSSSRGMKNNYPKEWLIRDPEMKGLNFKMLDEAREYGFCHSKMNAAIDIFSHFNMYDIDRGIKRYVQSETYKDELEKITNQEDKKVGTLDMKYVMTMPKDIRTQVIQFHNNKEIKKIKVVKERAKKEIKVDKWQEDDLKLSTMKLLPFECWNLDRLFPRTEEVDVPIYEKNIFTGNTYKKIVAPYTELPTMLSYVQNLISCQSLRMRENKRNNHTEFDDAAAIVKSAYEDKRGGVYVKNGKKRVLERQESKNRDVSLAPVFETIEVMNLNNRIQKQFPELYPMLKCQRIFTSNDTTMQSHTMAESTYAHDVSGGGRFKTMFNTNQYFSKAAKKKIMDHFGYIEKDYSNFNISYLYKLKGIELTEDKYDEFMRKLLEHNGKTLEQMYSPSQIKMIRKEIKPLCITPFNVDTQEQFQRFLNKYLMTSPFFYYCKYKDKAFLSYYQQAEIKYGHKPSKGKTKYLREVASLLHKDDQIRSRMAKDQLNNFEKFYNGLMKTATLWSMKKRILESYTDIDIQTMNPILLDKTKIKGVIISTFKEIKEYMFKPNALLAQRAESDACLYLMNKLLDNNVPALSLHDAIYCPISFSLLFDNYLKIAFDVSIKKQERINRRISRIMTVIKQSKIKIHNHYFNPHKNTGLGINTKDLAKIYYIDQLSKLIRVNAFEKKEYLLDRLRLKYACGT